MLVVGIEVFDDRIAVVIGGSIKDADDHDTGIGIAPAGLSGKHDCQTRHAGRKSARTRSVAQPCRINLGKVDRISAGRETMIKATDLRQRAGSARGFWRARG
jgi:hypothetical protein